MCGQLNLILRGPVYLKLRLKTNKEMGRKWGENHFKVGMERAEMIA